MVQTMNSISLNKLNHDVVDHSTPFGLGGVNDFHGNEENLPARQITSIDFEKQFSEDLRQIKLADEDSLRYALQFTAFLLQYPETDWLATIEQEIDSIKLPILQTYFHDFLQETKTKSSHELAQHYVDLFDFGATTSLYLSYSKTGDGRERGQLLVELKSMYREYGLIMANNELSDYLPVILEFASVAPLQVSVNLFSSFKEVIEILATELVELQTAYASLLEAAIFSFLALDKLQSEKEESV